MKKVLLGLLVALAVSLNAQIESGKILIGGEFGFNSNSQSSVAPVAVDINKSMNLTILPQIGYALSENLAFGLGIGYDYGKNTSIDAIAGTAKTFDYVNKEGMFVIAPFARYYQSTGEKSFAFAEFALPLGFGSSNDNQINTAGDNVEDANQRSMSSFGVNLSFGFNYFLNDKCALEAKWVALTYGSTKYTTTDGAVDPNTGNTIDAETKSTNLGFGIDMSALRIGLRIFI